MENIKLKNTSSWIFTGRAAKNSGLTSVNEDPSLVLSLETFKDLCLNRCNLNCSAMTSCLMLSGRAAKKDGSTPSGISTPAKKNCV